MRLWAEERNSGSIELLMTLPITLGQAVAGKFLAAWVFAGIALLLTFPIWITVNYLGSPDNGAIVAAYIGSWLMAGGFLAIGTCLSAATRNQVIAFITAALVCFVFLLAGFPFVLDFVRASARARLPVRATPEVGAAWSESAQRLAAYLGGDYPTAQRVGQAAGEEMAGPSSPGHAWTFGLARVIDGLAAVAEG